MDALTPLLEGDCARAFDEIRRLIRRGDERGAIEAATTVAAQAQEPRAVGRALLLKAACLFNLGRAQECPALLDHAFDVLSGRGEHDILGALHAVAGIIAASSSLERCVRHFVQGSRELEKVEHPGPEAVETWHNLAVAYSHTGFHTQAADMAERAYLLGQAIGFPRGDHALPEIGVRRAVSLDHLGDSEGCARTLARVVDTWARLTDPSDLWFAEQNYYSYATRRLAVLGHDVEVVPMPDGVEAPSWEYEDLHLLGTACTAILEGRPHDALTQLEGKTVHRFTLGDAELFRIRALAYDAAGDPSSAWAADRRATRLATELVDQLHSGLVDGTRLQLDLQALRHSVERYATEALTDPLTGLPNRRHFDRFMLGIANRPSGAVVGIVDLDGFKAVNTVHGHTGGDLVLQRLAVVLARTVRRGDFVARYGGDEFILILPDSDLNTAQTIATRISNAVAGEDWTAFVPGTPVSVTIGWAELNDSSDIKRALEVADHAMLAKKSNGAAPTPY
jgi:diguanylate cyclase (GGDEF)-like protein